MAVTAAAAGLKVIVLERDTLLGGTSAISGGALWIPCSRQAIAGGFTDSLDRARTYLQHVTGDCYRSDLIEGFLHHGPEALAFLERHTDLRYTVRPLSPDYYPELPGATDRGRALEVGEYRRQDTGPVLRDAATTAKRHDGPRRHDGEPNGHLPLFEHASIDQVVSASGALVSEVLHGSAAILARHAAGNRECHGCRVAQSGPRSRGRHPHWGDDSVVLTDSSGRVVGTVTTLKTGETIRIHSRGGVALGTGGLSRRADAQTERPDTGDDHLSMAAPASDGSMMSMAGRELGAQIGGGLKSSFYWAPMFAMRDGDRSVEVFPHIVTDRAKPGIVAVTDRGVRFTNEANSYHRFVEAMPVPSSAAALLGSI